MSRKLPQSGRVDQGHLSTNAPRFSVALSRSQPAFGLEASSVLAEVGVALEQTPRAGSCGSEKLSATEVSFGNN